MPSPLYAITDQPPNAGQVLVPAVAAALRGGCRRIQYRDKGTDNKRRTDTARQLLQLCRDFGAELLINDDIELAFRVGAHGVHLGQGDASPREARRRLGAEAVIGVTCHDSLSLARAALDDGASYLAFGRFFSSRTKPDAPAAPLELLSRARDAFGITPIVAIGGITLDNAPRILAAGADWLAVSHHLFSAPDIEGRSRAFARLNDAG